MWHDTIDRFICFYLLYPFLSSGYRVSINLSWVELIGEPQGLSLGEPIKNSSAPRGIWQVIPPPRVEYVTAYNKATVKSMGLLSTVTVSRTCMPGTWPVWKALGALWKVTVDYQRDVIMTLFYWRMWRTSQDSDTAWPTAVEYTLVSIHAPVAYVTCITFVYTFMSAASAIRRLYMYMSYMCIRSVASLTQSPCG